MNGTGKKGEPTMDGQPITVLLTAEGLTTAQDFEEWAGLFNELENEGAELDDLTFGSEECDGGSGSIVTACLCMTLKTPWDVEMLHNLLNALEGFDWKVEFIKQA